MATEVAVNDPVYGPAASNQILATAASDGESYLVLWIDRRAYPPSTIATRVSGEGRVLDPTGILLARQEIFRPSIVWSGSSYFIAWRDRDDLWLMRLGADGVIVENAHLFKRNAVPGRLGSDGARVALTYLDGSPATPRAHFFTPDGETIADVKLAEAGEYGAPQVAWNGSELVAIWLRTTRAGTTLAIEGVRFDAGGPREAARTLVSNDNVVDPALASDGNDLVLVTRDFGSYRHGARRISGDLATVGPKRVLPDAISFAASIQWLGSSYVVTGERGTTVSALRLDRDGRPAGNTAAVIENVVSLGLAPTPALATNGSDLFVAWAAAPATSSAESDVYGAVVSASTLARRSRELLSVSATRQIQPVIASSGNDLLTLWLEGNDLYARRSTPGGQAIDAAPLRLTDKAWSAAVAFNGASYTVAWTEENAVVTRRVSADGAFRADGGSRITTKAPASVALASNGASTLLAWGGGGVNVVRLRADASAIDSVPLPLTSSMVGKVALSPNDSGDFLVVWGELKVISINGPPYPVDVRGARVSSGLTNLDGAIDIATSSGFEGDPAAVWNGAEWLVVWHRSFSDASGTAKEIRGRRIARNGTFLDGVSGDAGVLVARNAYLPAVAWDGARYFLAWHEGTPTFGVRLLRTARLAQLGAALSGERTIGEAEWIIGGSSSSSMSFAAIAPSVIASSYARIAREPQYGGVSRAFLDVLAFLPRRRAAR